MVAMGSYYDPNTTETLRAFGVGLQGLCQGNFTDEQVRESVLTIFARLDAPNEVPTRGTSEFHYGYTANDQQLIRDEFFKVDRESLVKLANEIFGHIGKESFVEMLDVNSNPLKASVSVFGNKASAEQALFQSDRWAVSGASK
jgi:Zn-dependent M16 (insulinase) family peptidase